MKQPTVVSYRLNWRRLKMLWSINLILLKFLLVMAKLALIIPG